MRARGMLTAAAVLASLLAGAVGAAPASAAGVQSTAVQWAAVAAAKSADVELRGVSAAGAEFSSTGTLQFDTAASFRFLASRGYTLVRLPFLWESIQPTLSAPLDPAALAALHAAVANAKAAGLAVVLDVHNYARYDGVAYGEQGSFTAADFADLWRRLSLEFRGESAVMGYGLMNEPHDLPTVDGVSGNERWQQAQQAALDAVRANGDVTCVIVSGYSWGSMGAWLNETGGQPAPYIHDPADNIRWEAHQYWDYDNSGKYTSSYAQAVASGWGSSESDAARSRVAGELDAWLSWLEQYHQKGFIGEFGWPSTGTSSESDLWDSMARLFFGHLDAAPRGLVWTAAWATGARWGDGYELQLYGTTNGTLSTPYSNALVLEQYPARRDAAAGPGAQWSGADGGGEGEPVVPDSPTGPVSPPTPVSPTTPVVPTAPVVPVLPAAPVSPPKATTPAKTAPKPVAAAVRSRTVARPRPSVIRARVAPRLAIVISATKAITGTVTVREGTRVLKTVRLHGSHLTVTLPRLRVGTHRLTVRYSGSATVASSIDTANRIVVRR